MHFGKFVTLLVVFASADGQLDPQACTGELGPCQQSEDCCLEQGCQKGVCLNCTRSGNACTHNSKCCECTTEKCIDSSCQRCSIRGTFCSSDDACCGNPGDECWNNKCAQCTQKGDRCYSRGPCCRGHFCCNDICETCLSAESTCTTDESCCPETGCISGVCKNCTVKCSTDLHCPCAETACLKETCRKCFVLGQECRSDSNCCTASPNCQAGHCERCANVGQSCSSHRGCCKSRLDNTFCVNRLCQVSNGTVAIACSQPVELMILLDSAGVDGFVQAKEFVANFIESFQHQSRIGLIVLATATRPSVIISLNHAFNMSDLKRLIMAAPNPPTLGTLGGPSTPETHLAIEAAVVELTKHTRGFQKKMMIITSGKSAEPDKTMKASEQAQKQGIVGYSVGIGTEIDRPELIKIAGGSVARTRIIGDYAALATATSSLSVLVCDE